MATTNGRRFEVILKEGSQLSAAGQTLILRDRKTGVQYLMINSGYGCALTPLLDAEGKPVVDYVPSEN